MSCGCDGVIECLITALGGESGDDLTTALRDWLRDNQNQVLPYPDPTGGAISATADNLNTQGCDPDILFGFCLQMVQAFDNWVMQLFESIDVTMNVVELGAVVADLVPVLGEVLELVEYYRDAVKTNYAAQYTDQLEKEIACDLFCIMMRSENCTMTWDEIYDYFSQQTAYGLADVNIFNWAEFVTQGQWTGNEFVYIAMMTLVTVIGAGADWAGITLEYIQKTIGAWFNDPNPDWATYCTDCVWEYTWDWTTQGEGGWVIDSIFIAEYQGVYVPGVGWQETAQDNSDNPEEGHDWSKALCISYTLPVASQINYIQTTYDFVNSGHWDGTDNNQVVYGYGQDPTTHYIEYSAVTDATGNDKHGGFVGTQYQPASKIRIRLVSGRWWQNSNPGGSATLKSIVIRGRGDNPFL